MKKNCLRIISHMTIYSLYPYVIRVYNAIRVEKLNQFEKKVPRYTKKILHIIRETSQAGYLKLATYRSL